MAKRAKRVEAHTLSERDLPGYSHSVDLAQYRSELLDKHKGILAFIKQLQEQATQAVGQLNANAGELKAVNRMLGRDDADTQA